METKKHLLDLSDPDIPVTARLRAWIAFNGFTQRDAAPKLGLSYDKLSRGLNGRGFKQTDDAAGIERATGIPAAHWSAKA